jgi:hypothetical protein
MAMVMVMQLAKTEPSRIEKKHPDVEKFSLSSQKNGSFQTHAHQHCCDNNSNNQQHTSGCLSKIIINNAVALSSSLTFYLHGQR